MYMDRRTHFEDMRAELEAQTFNLFPDRWRELYFRNTFLGSMSVEEAKASQLEAEIPADIDELDDYYNNLGKKRKISGADIPDDFMASNMWGTRQ